MSATILKRLIQLSEPELFRLSEAIDAEVERRAKIGEDVPDSARRRAVERQQSYRRRVGTSAPSVKVSGLGKSAGPRRAA
jgi:hypothetical protein